MSRYVVALPTPAARLPTPLSEFGAPPSPDTPLRYAAACHPAVVLMDRDAGSTLARHCVDVPLRPLPPQRRKENVLGHRQPIRPHLRGPNIAIVQPARVHRRIHWRNTPSANWTAGHRDRSWPSTRHAPSRGLPPRVAAAAQHNPGSLVSSALRSLNTLSTPGSCNNLSEP